MMEMPDFKGYLTHDEDGFISGISDDAPEEIKRLYQDWVREYEEAAAQGIKL